jgi:excinuclease UvrABC ATPase subunit
MAAADIRVPDTLPTVIGVRGARHNNLRDIDMDVPLWRMVAVVGVSGSGKTSLAMGTLYAEGLQRFLEGLSTYSRRRLTQAQRPDVDRIDHLPPALALRQRPPIPGPRSTVGTMSEVLNVLRLMMSRLGSHLCPNGHLVAPSIATQSEQIVCPVCGARFEHPSAESFAFNSYGACPACHGLGVRSEVDVATLVPDPGQTIADGAVLPWNSGGRRLSMYAAGELGVRLDVPYRELTDREREIVLHGEPVRRQVTLSGRNGRTVQLSVNYDNAVAAVERSLRSDNERTRRLVEKFLVTRVCSVCHGTRLRPEALTSLLGGRNLAQISALRLGELHGFTAGAPAVPPDRTDRLDRAERAGPGGEIVIEIGDLYNLHNVAASFPEHRLTAVAGPSGAGKTALVLDSLIPAAKARLSGSAPPAHVRRLELGDIRQVVQIDASPIGQNARSTPATYCGAFDQIRRVFADSGPARRRRWKPGHFSFNTREGQCPTCRGIGHIDLDVQYLPDIAVQCPTCHGARFNDATLTVQVDGLTIADVLGLSVHDALERFAGRAPVAAALRPVSDVGLGYLRLGEPTPSLSGGESQRLRIASRLRSSQRGALYVFDEPSTGLHPLDVATLAGVFGRLMDAGATIIVIDHDLDLLAAADHLIDMGPGGGPEGGHILAAGTPGDVARDPDSVTGPWLAEHLSGAAPASTVPALATGTGAR